MHVNNCPVLCYKMQKQQNNYFKTQIQYMFGISLCFVCSAAGLVFSSIDRSICTAWNCQLNKTIGVLSETPANTMHSKRKPNIFRCGCVISIWWHCFGILCYWNRCWKSVDCFQWQTWKMQEYLQLIQDFHQSEVNSTSGVFFILKCALFHVQNFIVINVRHNWLGLSINWVVWLGIWATESTERHLIETIFSKFGVICATNHMATALKIEEQLGRKNVHKQ